MTSIYFSEEEIEKQIWHIIFINLHILEVEEFRWEPMQPGT